MAPFFRMPPARQSRWLFLAAGGGVMVALMIAIGMITMSLNASLHSKVSQHLANMSSERADLFGLWVNERLGDATLLQKDPFLNDAILDYTRSPENTRLENKLTERLQGLISTYSYHQISLLSPDGKTLLKVSTNVGDLLTENEQLVQRAVLGTDSLSSDLYVIEGRNGDLALSLDLVAPIFGPDGTTPIAVVALHVDPAPFLNKIIAFNENIQNSEEILIGRKQNDNVLILAPNQNDKASFQLLRRPLSQVTLPAAQSAAGHRGSITGIDYRGEAVFAYSHPLDNSEWFILVKSPQNELRALQWENMLLALCVIAIILILSALLYTNYRSTRRRQGLEVALDDQREQAELLRKLIASERELRHSQEQLAHSELRFRAVMDNSPVPVALLDRNGTVAYVNLAFEQTFGYQHSDVPTLTTWRSLAYPDASYGQSVQEKWTQRLRLLEQENAPFQPLEIHVRCKDGTVKTVLAEAAYLAGLENLYVSTFYDITSRKQIEAELSALSAEYAQVIRSLPVGIFRYRICTDGRERFDYVSDLWCEQLGVTRQSVMADPASALHAFSIEDATSFWAFRRQKEHFHWQGQMAAPTTRRWLEVEATPQTLENGDMVWSGIQSDISLRRQIEEALTFERQSLLNILWATDVGTWEWDMHTGALRINERWASIAGYSRAELGEISIETWNRLVHPEDGGRSEQLLKQHFLGETSYYECEVRLRHKSGRWVWILDRGKVITRDKQGIPLTMAGTHLDITSRKQAEAILTQQREELSRSNSELEQFAYAVSHDLRQPLRMVHSYIQLLERRLQDVLNDDTRGMMGYAREGAIRMETMLVSLLEYSRVGRSGEPMAIMDSTDALNEALRFLQPAISEANARITISGDWPTVQASRDELTRLFQNLVGNALKYRLEDRVPEVTLSVQAEEDHWLFRVQDNGIGIAPEQTSRLFKVFQRLQSKDKYEGSGVGLAICKKIVDHHNGQIGVETHGEGEGCTFFFTLPMVDSATASHL